MKRIVRLTERDLTRLVRRVIQEQQDLCMDCVMEAATNAGITDVSEEKMQKVIDIFSGGEMPDISDIKILFPNPKDIMKGGKFLMQVMKCEDKCKGGSTPVMY